MSRGRYAGVRVYGPAVNSRGVRRPTPKEMSEWLDRYHGADVNDPARERSWTCATCGREGEASYVQPQHPYFRAPQPDGTPVAACGDCIAARNADARAEARAERMQPGNRCEACEARPYTFTVGHGNAERGPARLCGRCKVAAVAQYHRNVGPLGGLALFLPGPVARPESVIELARTGRGRA